jgi:hypothetical protein
MEEVLAKIHATGCTKASIYGPSEKLLAQDENFLFSSGEIGSVIRAFKSKIPAVRIAGNNHIVTERKTGKLPLIFLTSTEFSTGAVLMDSRKYIIVGLYEGSFNDKEKRDIQEKMEQLGQDILAKKF